MEDLRKLLAPLTTNEASPDASLTATEAKAFDAKAASNAALNAALVELDAQIQRYTSEAHVQMGILMMAQAMTFRRLLREHMVTDRGRRHRMLSLAVRDFESKLKAYGVVKD